MKKIKFLSAALAAVGAVFLFAACDTVAENKDNDKHNYVKVSETAPTCTEDGYIRYKCKDAGCDSVLDQKTDDALGHNYVHNFCARCGVFDSKAKDTEGLTFEPIYDKEGEKIEAYSVSGIGDAVIDDGDNNYVKIPSKYSEKSVKKIAADAFKDNTKLKAAILPSSIVEVGDGAFKGCAALVKAEIGSVEQIGAGAFEGCAALTDTELGKANDIGASAFKGCTSLKGSVVKSASDSGEETSRYVFKIPAANIYENAFEGCTAIVEAELSGAKTVSEYAFKDCAALKHATVSEYATVIEYSAFSGCASIESMTMPYVVGKATSQEPDKAPEIEYLHFGYIFGAETAADNAQVVPTSLKTVNVKGSKKIIDNAFSGVGIETVDLSGFTGEIGAEAFLNCASLKKVAFEQSSPRSIGDGAFKGCTAVENKELDIPISVSSIGLGAFEGWQHIETVSLPYACGGGDKPFGHIFGGETAAAVPASVKSLNVIGTKSIPSGAFEGCAIENARVSGTVSTVGNNAFKNCADLKTATLELGVKNVGDGAFESCARLASLFFGKKISIGKRAFYGCTTLKSVTFDGSITDFGAVRYADEYSTPLAYSAELFIGGVSMRYH